MSGECDDCGEHCLECRCMDEIKVWIQMFCVDGSVSEGKRIPAEWLDENNEAFLDKTCFELVKSMNREEAHVLIWGAGNIKFGYYSTASSCQESYSSVSLPQTASPQ